MLSKLEIETFLWLVSSGEGIMYFDADSHENHLCNHALSCGVTSFSNTFVYLVKLHLTRFWKFIFHPGDKN